MPFMENKKNEGINLGSGRYAVPPCKPFHLGENNFSIPQSIRGSNRVHVLLKLKHIWVYQCIVYSRCVKLFEFRDGLRLLSGHEPINDQANNQGEEEEVQVAEKRLLFFQHGLSVSGGISFHVCHFDSLKGHTEHSCQKFYHDFIKKKEQKWKALK